MKAYDIYNILVTRDKVIYGLVLALLEGILGYMFNIPVMLIFSAILMFSVFDAYGFFYLTQYGKSGIDDYVRTAIYRIIQNLFFVLLIIVLLLIAPWHAAFMFVMCWWFGVCDYFYYVLLKQENYLNSLEDMPWLWWTPYGIVLRMFNKPIPNGCLKFFSWTGIIILTIYGIFG